MMARKPDVLDHHLQSDIRMALGFCDRSIPTHWECSSPDLGADQGKILWTMACDLALVLVYLCFGTMVEAQEQGGRPSSTLHALVKTHINNLLPLLCARRRRRVCRHWKRGRQPGSEFQPVQPALSFGIVVTVSAKERHIRCQKSRNIAK